MSKHVELTLLAAQTFGLEGTNAGVVHLWEGDGPEADAMPVRAPEMIDQMKHSRFEEVGPVQSEGI